MHVHYAASVSVSDHSVVGYHKMSHHLQNHQSWCFHRSPVLQDLTRVEQRMRGWSFQRGVV